MRFLVASDIHGSLSRAQYVFDTMNTIQADRLLLLGDILYHGPRNPLPDAYAPREVAELLNSMQGKILAVRGNCDAEVDQMLLHFPLLETALVDADGLTLQLRHGHHEQLPDRFEVIPQGHVLLCGHTHIPRAETTQGIHVWNPGSVSLPKQGHVASYGIIEDGVFSIYTLENTLVMRHAPLA